MPEWLDSYYVTTTGDRALATMRRQKRDMNDRAYHKGYQAGLVGRSMESCPHSSEQQRHNWISGWREGRSDNWDGYTGVSGVHREPQQ